MRATGAFSGCPISCSAIQSCPVSPASEHAVGDIARHFLRADQHALDLRIVDRRKVRSRVDAQDVAGALKQLDRRVLQRSLRNAQSQLHRRSPTSAFST
jgi:hypothetical protein